MTPPDDADPEAPCVVKKPEDPINYESFIDLGRLGPALHALCPRSRRIGDACDGVSRVAPEGLLHDCVTCGIESMLLLPRERANPSGDN